MLDRIRKALKRRPVRVVEAVLAFVAAVGVAVTPEVEEAVRLLVPLAAVGIVGGEVAQRQTTPTTDPSLPDGHVPGDADPDETQ